jgi:hypothetical protein
LRVVRCKRAAAGARREPERDARRHEIAGARDLGFASGDDGAHAITDPL